MSSSSSATTLALALAPQLAAAIAELTAARTVQLLSAFARARQPTVAPAQLRLAIRAFIHNDAFAATIFDTASQDASATVRALLVLLSPMRCSANDAVHAHDALTALADGDLFGHMLQATQATDAEASRYLLALFASARLRYRHDAAPAPVTLPVVVVPCVAAAEDVREEERADEREEERAEPAREEDVAELAHAHAPHEDDVGGGAGGAGGASSSSTVIFVPSAVFQALDAAEQMLRLGVSPVPKAHTTRVLDALAARVRAIRPATIAELALFAVDAALPPTTMRRVRSKWLSASRRHGHAFMSLQKAMKAHGRRVVFFDALFTALGAAEAKGIADALVAIFSAVDHELVNGVDTLCLTRPVTHESDVCVTLTRRALYSVL